MRLQGKDFLIKVEFGKEEAMKITGTVTEEDMRIREANEGGLDNRSGMRFWSPLICCAEKSYLENHVLRWRRCLSRVSCFLNQESSEKRSCPI